MDILLMPRIVSNLSISVWPGAVAGLGFVELAYAGIGLAAGMPELPSGGWFTSVGVGIAAILTGAKAVFQTWNDPRLQKIANDVHSIKTEIEHDIVDIRKDIRHGEKRQAERAKETAAEMKDMKRLMYLIIGHHDNDRAREHRFEDDVRARMIGGFPYSFTTPDPDSEPTNGDQIEHNPHHEPEQTPETER
jgi:hypothetical protein